MLAYFAYLRWFTFRYGRGHKEEKQLNFIHVIIVQVYMQKKLVFVSLPVHQRLEQLHSCH